jgi:hypothetical protein
MDWKAEKYDETFDDAVATIEMRRNTDPSFGIADLEAILHAQYVDQDNDWIGRGAAFEIKQKATIDAYEHLLRKWKAIAATETTPA